MAATFHGYAIVPTTDDGTNTADPTAITPPGSMAAGDLVVLWATCRTASATLAISQAGGQTWNSEDSATSTNITSRLFWCRFNGTWSANPSVSFGATTCNSVSMLVFRPTTGTNVWALDQGEAVNSFAAPSTPFTVTITGQTTTNISVAVALWSTTDNNTWDTLSGTGWVKTSLPAQNRNSSGQDISQTWAYKIQTGSGATNDVSQNQATLGGDLGVSGIACFYEQAAAVDLVPAEGSQTNAGDEAALTQVHVLAPDEGAQENAGDNAALTQVHQLAADEGIQTQLGDEATIEVVTAPIDLIPVEGTQDQSGDNAVLTQVHVLAPAEGAQDQAGDNADLTQVHVLAPAEGSQDQVGDNAIVEVTIALTADEGSQDQSGDGAALTQVHILAPDEGVQTQLGDPATLEVMGLDLFPAEGSQDQAGDNAALTQVHALAVDEGAQAQAGDGADLTQVHVLTPAEGSQDQSGDAATLELVTATVLVPAEGSQDQSGDEVSLIVGRLVLELYRVTPSDRVVLVVPQRRTERIPPGMREGDERRA